jgi:hypothetical protein
MILLINARNYWVFQIRIYDTIIMVIGAVLNGEKNKIIKKILQLFRPDFFIEGPKSKFIF